MGANAQTAVPVFTSGQVLTAAQVTQINTGIPVFATTTTRDAAFGGIGEKTLAEGQFAYIEATNTTQYYDGASWLGLGGKLGQVVSTIKSDTFTMASTTYATVTGLSATITPTATSSKIYIVASLVAVGQSATLRGAARLIRDSTAIAVPAAAGSRTVGTTIIPLGGAAEIYSSNLTFLDSPASTSALVYAVQVRGTDAGTIYVNRSEADVDASSYVRTVSTITVMEILA